jgi:hypothetical protein
MHDFFEKDSAMKKLTNTNDIRNLAMLSQLAGMLDCSLARYLVNARPWVRRPYLLLGAVARRLATEHEYHAGELVRLLHARSHNATRHTYPMEFTYYNDLSLEYLAPRLLDHQHRLITFSKAVSIELSGDYEAERILEKLLASLRRYGSLLEELLAPHRLAPPTSGEHRTIGTIAGRRSKRAVGSSARSMESQTAA